MAGLADAADSKADADYGLEKSELYTRTQIMTNREGGMNVVREMMGDEAAAKPSASADSNTFGAPIAAYAVDQVFADIWTRPGLDTRCPSLDDCDHVPLR